MLLGTLVNAGAIILGSLLGLLIKKEIPKRLERSLLAAMGLVVLVIGLQYALATQNVLWLLGSMVAGALIGEIIDIDRRLVTLGVRFNRSTESLAVSDGFIAATLLFCVGSMAVMGAFESGIYHNHTIFYTKAIIDMIAALVLASTLGKGVLFSALSVFIYQGTLTLLASLFGGLIPESILTEITAVGGILLIAVSLTLLGYKQIRAANWLPAMLIPLLMFFFI